MDDIFIYLIVFPSFTTKEAVVPGADGYTIYIDIRLSHSGRLMAFLHALGHIEDNDFSKEDIQIIEDLAHSRCYLDDYDRLEKYDSLITVRTIL